MKAIVCDNDILKNLEPPQLAAYLQASGWYERTKVPNQVSTWTRNTFPEDKLKIYLPLDPDFEDYPRRMSEIIEILEQAENRSQLDILSELITTVPNITIQGVVMQVSTYNTTKLSGEITLFGVVIDKLRKIKAELKEHDYTRAIIAYQEHLSIICQGDLIRENNIFVLKNPRGITLDNLS